MHTCAFRCKRSKNLNEYRLWNLIKENLNMKYQIRDLRWTNQAGQGNRLNQLNCRWRQCLLINPSIVHCFDSLHQYFKCTRPLMLMSGSHPVGWQSFCEETLLGVFYQMVTLPYASCKLFKAIWSNLKPRCQKNIDLDHFQIKVSSVWICQSLSTILSQPLCVFVMFTKYIDWLKIHIPLFCLLYKSLVHAGRHHYYI